MPSMPTILVSCLALSLGATPGRSEPPSITPAAETCPVPEGWAEIANLQPRYIVFGELHGTQESPAFVGDLACALAAQDQRVLLAIEFDSGADAALQDAWRLPANEFAQALQKFGWKGRTDGVASEAMFAVLVRLHRLKDAGRPIDVAAFNGPRDESQRKRFAHLAGQGPHEAAQAENIHNAASSGSYDRVLVLVGGFHAETVPYGEGAKSFDPMAARLARTGRVVSLKMRFAAGSAWNCIAKPGRRFEPGQAIPKDAIECGNHPAKSEVDLERAPFMQLGAFPGEAPIAGFDGFFWLGSVHGSAPQVRADPPQQR
jgi:hypothetical protein